MIVDSFDAWKDAVHRENARLSYVHVWLSEAGRKRLSAFASLDFACAFHDTAAEFMAVLSEMTTAEFNEINDGAGDALHALMKIASEEAKN